MKKFRMTIETDVEIEFMDDAINVIYDKEWREQLYDLATPEEVASFLGYNMVVNDLKLSHIDGWADQPDDNANFIVRPEFSVTNIMEIK